MNPYVLLHIPANFFADLDVFSYWAGQKGIESLHVLSCSCGEGTRARVSPRGRGWAAGLGALTCTHTLCSWAAAPARSMLNRPLGHTN